MQKGRDDINPPGNAGFDFNGYLNMKLRVKGNSLRIRLTRSEVDLFAAQGWLRETTAFAGSTFIYSLRTREGISGLEAGFADCEITMYVPATLPAIWANNEVVGYDNHLDTGNGAHLYLLLEKDFKCIDAPPGEDQSDNFENPHKTC